MEMEPELEPQPDTDIMNTPVGEPQGEAEFAPRSSAVFFEPYPDVINGDVKRAILERMLDVLKVQPKELNHELQNVQPIGQHKVTSNAVGWYHDKHVSISQRADTYARSVGRLDK